MMRWKTVLRCAGVALAGVALWAQEPPDAEQTKQGLSQLLERYPPALKNVLALDPTLLGDQSYLAPYPALTTFLASHPEVARNPTYFFGRYGDRNYHMDRSDRMAELWRQTFQDLTVFTAFGLATGVLIWLVKTLIDYRRWNKLSKTQTEVHTKLLDRFSSNEDLLNYIQSPAGARFLQSAPITLDAGPRSMGAPLGRILWSLQAGVVLAAAGVGLQVAAARIPDDASQPFHMLGIVAIALGAGFAVSAGASFFISQRLGLIERGKVQVVNVQ